MNSRKRMSPTIQLDGQLTDAVEEVDRIFGGAEKQPGPERFIKPLEDVSKKITEGKFRRL